MKQNFRALFLALIVVISLLSTSCVTTKSFKKPKLIPSGEYFEKVHSLLNNASDSIFVAMYTFRYYTEYPNSPSNIFAQDLIKAKERGVNVNVLLDISDQDEENTIGNKKTGKILSENGIKVYYDAIGKTTHAKILVIDSRFTVLGSHNWTYHGLSKNPWVW